MLLSFDFISNRDSNPERARSVSEAISHSSAREIPFILLFQDTYKILKNWFKAQIVDYNYNLWYNLTVKVYSIKGEYGMKKILFGIALILFGFFSFYGSVIADWDLIQLLGLVIPVIGIGFSIAGFLDKDE